MKKVWTVLLCVTLSISLCACAGQKEASMYVEPAQLTEAERNMAELLVGQQENRIYDFVLDETVASMELRAYELVDGQWDSFISGAQQFVDTKGRLALEFEKIPENLRIALQSEHNSGATAYGQREKLDAPGMATATSILGGRHEIVYDQEIPLAVQIVTSKNEIRSFDVSFFFQPEEYAQYGYEHVYAITIRFSQQTVGEQE